MASERYTAEQVIEAIKGSRGIKETIRQRLGCSRNTVDNYLGRYATAQEAYDEEIEKIGDIAESLIVDDMIRNRNVETAKWYARVKLVKRGYGTGPTGDKDDPIHMTHTHELSDSDLERIAARGGSGTTKTQDSAP